MMLINKYLPAVVGVKEYDGEDIPFKVTILPVLL
jgi:hypothetical protein